MKTLEEIKDNYVMDKFLASHELDTWVDFQNYFASRHPEWFEQHNDEILKLYAIEVAKEALKNASENATINKETQYTGGLGISGLLYEETLVIDKESILNESNIPNL